MVGRTGTPAGYLDEPTDFGLRAGAHPYRVAADPVGCAASWASHLLVRRLRTWLPHLGAGTPNEWREARSLSKNTWANIFNGTRWLRLDEVAYIASQAPTPQDGVSAMEEFGRALRGDAFPPTPEQAQAPRRLSRAEVGMEMSRRRVNGLAKAVPGEPRDAAESVWWSLEALAERNGVEPPTGLVAYARDTIPDVQGSTAGAAVMTVPDPTGLPLPLVGSHAIIDGTLSPGSRVRALTYRVAEDGEGQFVTVDATVMSDGVLSFK